MKHFTAVCERDESGTWVVTVPELPGVITQTKRLDRAAGLAADAIALWLNTTPDQIEVELDVRLPAETAGLVNEATEMRRALENMQAQTAASLYKAALILTSELHLSMRDAAATLGVSHQRVQQLVKTSAATKTERSTTSVYKPTERDGSWTVKGGQAKGGQAKSGKSAGASGRRAARG